MVLLIIVPVSFTTLMSAKHLTVDPDIAFLTPPYIPLFYEELHYLITGAKPCKLNWLTFTMVVQKGTKMFIK